ncbi:MAG: hypothetical protein KAX49_17735 [Halanaerobiales bacterium]|nr:hypothetical protein [Halanaerobiales bacterium]
MNTKGRTNVLREIKRLRSERRIFKSLGFEYHRGQWELPLEEFERVIGERI